MQMIVHGIKISLIIFVGFSIQHFAQAQECSMIFAENSKFDFKSLDEKYPKIPSLYQFMQRHSESSELVWSQKFQKFVLLISLSGKNPEEIRVIEADYVSDITKGTLSFLAKERSTHLYVRYQDKVLDFFDHFHNPFRIADYKVPQKERLEPNILLTPFEKKQLLQYLLNIERDAFSTLGPFRYGGGTQSEGRIDQNRCQPGHNCVSWISTAPIGPHSEKLFEVMGILKQELVLTSPSEWIKAVIQSDLTEFLTFWTYERIEAGKDFVSQDDFSRWFLAD